VVAFSSVHWFMFKDGYVDTGMPVVQTILLLKSQRSLSCLRWSGLAQGLTVVAQVQQTIFILGGQLLSGGEYAAEENPKQSRSLLAFPI